MEGDANAQTPSAVWHCFAIRPDAASPVAVERDEVPELLASGARLWVNVLEPSKDDARWLGDTFGFHELTLIDVMNNEVRPHEALYGDVLFTVLNAVNLNEGHEQLDTINLNIFLTKQFIVSAHSQPLKTTRGVIRTMEQPNDPLSRGTDYVYYRLLDGVINRYLDIMDEVDEHLTRLETEIFETPSRRIQEEIFREKRRLAYLKRCIGPKRDTIRDLVYSEFPQIRPEVRTLLRDVQEHILRVADAIESYRELTSGLMDSYMSNISNRMNEVMKLMSIIATVMLPLSFLTGLFGMNFDVIPGLHVQNGFWFLMGIMGALVVGMILFFKKQGIM